MTTITINEPAQMILIQGHSGFASEGKDVLCAGISTLAWTLAGTLQHYGLLNYVDEKDGEILICYRDLPGAEQYLDMFGIGAEMLAIKYPDNVRVQGRKTIIDSDNMKTGKEGEE